MAPTKVASTAVPGKLPVECRTAPHYNTKSETILPRSAYHCRVEGGPDASFKSSIDSSTYQPDPAYGVIQVGTQHCW